MKHSTPFTKILIIAVIVIVLGIIISLLVKSSQNNMSTNDYRQTAASSSSSADLNEISTSSNVSNDMDAYIRSTNSVPGSNDFNDSYSDLNQ